MRPVLAEKSGRLRSRFIRRSVAVGAISAMLLGMAHATAHSSAEATAAAPFGIDPLTMMTRGNAVTRDNVRGQSPQAIAEARGQELTRTAEQLAATQQADALRARSTALGSTAARIDAESERLTDQSQFLMPTAGGFASRFGPRLHPILGYYRLHNGDDIGGDCGQPIWAAHDGKVVKAATGGYNGGSGNNVRIDAGKIDGVKVESAYLHMNSVKVRVGQKVHKGQLLGTVGNTGLSTACHLHFSVYENGKAIAPKKYLH